NTQRVQQGQPVIVQTGSSKTGNEFAAKHGEAIFTNKTTVESAQAYYKAVKTAAIQHGRKTEDIVILPALAPIVGATEEEAEAAYEQIKHYVTKNGRASCRER